MKKYTYKNKITGKKIYSNKKIVDDNLVLVSQIRDGQIKNSDNVITT